MKAFILESHGARRALRLADVPEPQLHKPGAEALFMRADGSQLREMREITPSSNRAATVR
ncbi:MAG: hypothetical protein LBJ40_16685 [Delftia acidovorans]|jgi:hypothetical protein|nr:hypothetical protein [Delftia acidovorans]